MLIWLGLEADNSHKAFKWIGDVTSRDSKQLNLIQEFNESLKRRRPTLASRHGPAETLDKWQQLGVVDPGMNNYMRDLKRRCVSGPAVEPMRKLLKNPYFTRIWIIQEVFYARRLKVLCGRDSVDWDTFAAASIFFTESEARKDRYPGLFGSIPSLNALVNLRRRKDLESSWSSNAMSAANSAPSQRFPTLDTIREVYPRPPDLRPPQPQTIPNANDPADPSSRSLLTVLSQFWSYSATNPKDNVYALLNMADSHNTQVDYRKNIAELFKDVALHIIVQSRNLGLLAMVDCARQTKNRLPSWTPDWADFKSRQSMTGYASSLPALV